MAMRTVLLILMSIVTKIWLLYWIFRGMGKGNEFLKKVDKVCVSTWIGSKGDVFVMQALPVIVLTFIGIVTLEVQRRNASTKSITRFKRRKHFWNQTLFWWSPFGPLTVANIVIIATVLFSTLWFFVRQSYFESTALDKIATSPGHLGPKPLWLLKLGTVAHLLGKVSMLPFALLWLPVSRSSPIFRTFGIPYEKAIKYHTWLGTFTIMILFCHGASFATFLVKNNEATHLYSWATRGTSILAGIMALTCLLLMLLTALPPVRRRFFDLFYRVHHLYLLVLCFFTFHVINQAYFMAIPVLLFLLDRFMRAIQSRKTVSVTSVNVLPSGVMEVKFAAPKRLTYHPLSFVYVLIPSVSRVQWHPFSVTSSPLDGTGELSVCIKPLGGFSRKLQNAFTEQLQIDANDSNKRVPQTTSRSSCPFSFKAAIEGPYSDESDFYLKYNSLVLIAGGIGVTPFLSILRDILHRYRLRQKYLPTSIELILSVRSPKELSILNTIRPREIMADYDNYITIKVHVFVTSKASRSATYPTQDDSSGVYNLASPEGRALYNYPAVHIPRPVHAGKAHEILCMTATGNGLWIAAANVFTIVGFLLVWGMCNVLIIKEIPTLSDDPTEVGFENYKKALLFLASITIAVTVFGGGVLFFWSRRASHKNVNEKAANSSKVPVNDVENMDTTENSFWQGTVTVGQRADWRDILSEVAREHEAEHIGVLVSGKPGMLQSVAKECQRHNFCNSKSMAVLHYHSVSFEL